MIVYVDTKNGKVDLTKDELKKLLKEEYDRGYNAGKKFSGSVTYSYPCYWSCPYRNWNYTTTSSGYIFDSNQVTCNSSDSKTITLNNSNISPINPISTETGTITFKEK